MGGESMVLTETVGKRLFANRIEALGTACANESVEITSPISGRITKILFDSGAMVVEGEALVQLENDEILATVEEAKVALDEEERELIRTTGLREKQVVAEQAYETRQSAVAAAKARLMAVESRLRDHLIVSPFAGELGIRRVSPGAQLNTGSVITTLDDLDIIKVEFTVPETFLAELKTGQSIEARSTAWPNETFTGTVTCIDSRVDAATRAVAIQARIPNPRRQLRAGMLLAIELISDKRDAVGVPEKALLAYAEMHYLFVLQQDQTVSRRKVQLGRRDAGWVEIEDGLSEGEIIVVEGMMNLQDGARVRVGKPDKSNEPASPTHSG
jgi:membrane fusion protein (multidrug efflux system)